MLLLGDIFKRFCRYVDDSIFSKDNVGSFVTFVVDKSFIETFCKRNGVFEADLMRSVRSHIYSRDISSIKSILAIQLYAASRRAYGNGITDKNYRDRLSQILNFDVNELQKWMQEYQEESWERLYGWCDSNFFRITKCERRSGTGRYVQYPLVQALRVFTEEDLKYIAAAFVDKGLQPGEDLRERDFWRMFNNRSIISYIGTRHGNEVIDNSLSEEDYKIQIFNFYLRWNGEYKRKNSCETQVRDKTLANYCLYLRNSYKQIDVRTQNLVLVSSFHMDRVSSRVLKEYYSFKRKGIILFRKDDIYDDTWQETRYLEKGEEGILVCIKHECCGLMDNSKVLFQNNKVVIYKIKESISTKDFFTLGDRLYVMEGGLKVGRNVYIKGGGPTLRIEKTMPFWLDGELVNDGNLEYNMNDLGLGIHTIKFPHLKMISIEIVPPKLTLCEWGRDNNKWCYDKKKVIWQSSNCEIGNVGLDFSSISQISSNGAESILRRWSDSILRGVHDRKEENIGIKIIH